MQVCWSEGRQNRGDRLRGVESTNTWIQSAGDTEGCLIAKFSIREKAKTVYNMVPPRVVAAEERFSGNSLRFVEICDRPALL